MDKREVQNYCVYHMYIEYYGDGVLYDVCQFQNGSLGRCIYSGMPVDKFRFGGCKFIPNERFFSEGNHVWFKRVTS